MTLDPVQFVLMLPGLLAAFVFHELSHAGVAYALGDPTPRQTGRLSLNPLRHIDPIGFLMLLVFKFGWAKPVQVDTRYFANPQRGMMLVAAAGPLANFIMAYVALALLRVLHPGGMAGAVLQDAVIINVGLGVFNLLPLPPLDGSKVLAGLLPARQAYAMERFEPMGWIVLILLLGFGLLGPIVVPLSEGVIRILDALTAFLAREPYQGTL